MQVFEDIDQGTPEWFACRAGIPTASKFATVMAKGEGKTRSEYMRRLAGEIITGEPTSQFSNAHTERGFHKVSIMMDGQKYDLYGGRIPS